MKRLIVCFVLCYIIAGFCGCTYQKDGFMSLEYVPALQLHYKTDANLSYGRISATSDGVIYYFDNSQSAILQMSSDGTKRVLCQANDIRRMQVIGDNLYLLEFESMRENDYGCFPNYVLYRYSIKDGKKTSIFFEESRFASYLADVKAEKRSNALYDFYIDNDNYVYLAWLHWSPKLETPDIRLEILNTEGKLNGSDITLIRPAKRLLSNKDELLSVGRINNIYIVTDFISDYSSVALVSATLTDGENNQIVMHFDQEIYYPHSTNITENATIVECIAGKKIVFLGNRIIVFCQNFQEENSVCQLAKERSIVRMKKLTIKVFMCLLLTMMVTIQFTVGKVRQT